MAITDPKAPVLVGVGETSGKALGMDWPSTAELAAAAIKTALTDSGAAEKLVDSIDCLLSTRLFHDSGLPHDFGSPENHPEAVATAAGLDPETLLYGDVGGQSPQKHLNKLACDVHEGKYKAVVLSSAENVGTVKRARRSGQELDWNQPATREMTDLRTDEDKILTPYEWRQGLISMPMSYGIVENARRARLGIDRDSYAKDMAELWSAFSQVSVTREHAQFARAWSAEELLEDGSKNFRINDPYRRWMVAQDAVELGAAVILTTAGHAAELGIAEDKMIYLHSGADASVPLMSQQDDLSVSPAMESAFPKAMELAEVEADDLGPIDIYSCFPVAVSLGIDALGSPDRPLSSYTLTGGLTFFGGPGNSYSTHGIVALVEALRKDGSKPGMISANGGVINKESVGIYAAQPVEGGWSPGRIAEPYRIPKPDHVKADHFFNGDGIIRSYCMPYGKGSRGAASLWLEDEQGLPAIGMLPDAPEDTDLIGMKVTVKTHDDRNIATLAG
jgi:acetyl-CoA C-acetyltransferase